MSGRRRGDAMTIFACECEHVCHEHGGPFKLSPNGNPGHKYGASKFAAGFIIPVKTSCGTFNVCKDCAEDCLFEYGGREALL